MIKSFKDKSIKLINETAVSKINNQAIMLDLKSGVYFELNEVGTFIVQHLKSLISFSEINELVIKTFGVDKKRCELDVINFLNELNERSLIEIHKID
tara:strand:- start:3405 stop:3695 length:291 start_codon:yes stop_codon:yes gene_type:complete